MTDTKTFDLAGALAGRTYPEETAVIFLDEALMYAYHKATEDHLHDPANADKLKAVADMEETFASAALRVKIKGCPPHLVREMAVALDAEFPVKKNVFGQIEPNPERGEAFAIRLWSLYITSITGPDGSSMTPSPEDLKALRDTAPESATEAIDGAIARLREGAEKGYTEAVSDLGFLSKP